MSTKLIGLALLLCVTLSLNAQNLLTYNQLNADAVLHKEDSTLTITYHTDTQYEYLLWTGDFTVAAITTRGDISYNYLGSPIVNEIFFVNKKILSKQTNGYFIRQGASEANLGNYTFIYKDHPVVITLKIDNDELFKLISSKKLDLRITATLINYSNINEFYLKDRSTASQWLKKFRKYEDSDDSGVVRPPIKLENIHWAFGRPPSHDPKGAGIYFLESYGDLSKDMYVPEKSNSKDLILPSVDALYQFANKIYLRPKIKIIR